jgi:hypothetical protein
LVTASSTPASSQLHEPARRPARSIEPAADAHTTLGCPGASATATRLWRPLVTPSLRRHTELVEALDRLDIDVAELHASLLTYATGEPARPCTSCAFTPRGLTREGRQELSSGQVPEAPKITKAQGGVRPVTPVEAENAASALVDTVNFHHLPTFAIDALSTDRAPGRALR